MDSLAPTEKLLCRQALLRVLLGASGEFSTSSPGAARSGSSPALRDVGQERAALYTEIGDLLAGPLGQPEDAITAYKDGLALQPGSLTILHKLLEVYGDNRMWAEAAGVLEELVEGEKKESRRARFKQTAALIYRDELRDLPRALKLFNSALDDDASLIRCLDAVEAIATELDEPKELLRAYQRKIKALGPDTGDTPKQRAERLRLWTALSRLCIQRLGDPQTGMAAFEVTVALEPENLDRQRQLAAIYSTLGSTLGSGAVKVAGGSDLRDKAIEQHQRILVRHKGELASYRALKDLYGQTGQRDKAQAVAAALQLLKQGDASDEELVRELRERPLRPATRPLSKELWRMLAHPEEDARLSALFALALKVTLPGQGRPRAELGLGSRNRVDLGSAQFAPKALRYAFEMLDTEVPEVYIREGGRADSEAGSEPFRLLLALEKGTPGASPALCAELSPALLDGKRPEREVMYEFGRLAALLRPERALRVIYPTAAQLGLIVDAALSVAGLGGGAQRVQETARGLKGALPQPAQEQLVRIARSLAEGTTPSASPSFGEDTAALWLGGSDLTAVRAGFLLCGDLETAALLLATDPPGTSRLSPKQRLLELIHFSVTEECFTIRRHLGL
jgi:tetratricopeptide (TPR) repeat protein